MRRELPAIEDLEIVDLEILDEPPLLVAHHRRDPNHVDARLEGSDRRRLILSPQDLETRKAEQRRADDPEGSLCHAGPLVRDRCQRA